jgi:hypothetical protein
MWLREHHVLQYVKSYIPAKDFADGGGPGDPALPETASRPRVSAPQPTGFYATSPSGSAR